MDSRFYRIFVDLQENFSVNCHHGILAANGLV
jgi:hypothetical protein